MVSDRTSPGRLYRDEYVTAYVEGLNAGLGAVDPEGVPELARLGIVAEVWVGERVIAAPISAIWTT